MKAYARPHFHGWGYRLFLIWGVSGRKRTQRIFRSMYSGWLISGPQRCWLSIWKCGWQSRFSCSSWAHSRQTSCHYCKATAQDTLTPAEVHCGKGTVSSSLRSSADLSLVLDNICTIGTRIYLTFLFLFTSMGYYKSTAYLMCPTKALVPSACREMLQYVLLGIPCLVAQSQLGYLIELMPSACSICAISILCQWVKPTITISNSTLKGEGQI